MKFIILTISVFFYAGPVWALVNEKDTPRSINLAPDPVSSGEIAQLLIGLFIVIGAIIAVAFFMKKYGRLQYGNHSNLKVVSGISLGQRERAVVVQVGDKQLLLGIAPGRVQTLYELEKPLVQNVPESFAGRTFAERLSLAIRQRVSS